MKTGSIYIIRNTINKKVYIGQTTMSVSERFSAHKKHSTDKMRASYKIYNAMNKYGVENFYVEVLEKEIPIDKLDEKETEYIKQYDSYHNGYNSTKGGDGRMITKIEDENKLLSLFMNGKSAKEIASEFGCCKATVFRTLRKLGYSFHDDVDYNKLKDLFNAGLTHKEISENMGIPKWTIGRACAKINLKRRRDCTNTRCDLDKNEVMKDYVNNMSIQEICSKHDISKTTLYRIKEELRVQTRPQVYKNKIRYR